MRHEAKVTSKGQITLPVELRKALGIKPGDQVDFLINEKGNYELLARTRRFEDLRGMLKTSVVLDDDQLAEAIEESWGARWKHPAARDGGNS